MSFWILVLALCVAKAVGQTSTPRPANFVPLIDEATARPANSVEVFLAKDERGQVSTLASLDATVVLWPDEAREIRIEMPQEIASSAAPSVGWRCGAAPAPDQSLLAVTWSTFQLCFVVSQKDRNWTLDQILFAFNSSELTTETDSKGTMRKFSSKDSSINQVQAPTGYSYRCLAAKQYRFSPLDDSTDNAILILSNFQLQPFTKDKTTFGEEIVCAEDKFKPRRRHRDSAVTIAVGSTLAVLSVVTVIGYALFRYFKVKAIGYGTME